MHHGTIATATEIILYDDSEHMAFLFWKFTFHNNQSSIAFNEKETKTINWPFFKATGMRSLIQEIILRGYGATQSHNGYSFKRLLGYAIDILDYNYQRLRG